MMMVAFNVDSDIIFKFTLYMCQAVNKDPNVCLCVCDSSGGMGGVKSYGNLSDSHRPFPTLPEATPHQNTLP